MKRSIDSEPEVRTSYSSGAYLYVLDRDVAGWRRRADYLRTLPGLRHVELWCEEIGLQPEELAELRKIIDGWQVVVHAPHLQLSMISHHDLVRGAAAEVFRRTLALADELGARVVTFHAGTRPFVVDEGLALDQIAAMMAALRATGCKAEPTIKNLIGDGKALLEYPASLEELRRVMERVPEQRITLDVGHAVQGGDNWISFLRAHAASISNIHLHDAEPDEQGQKRPLDVFALARLLRAVGYGGYVTLATVGQRDTTAAWALWQQAIAEAAQETTATLEAGSLQRR